MFKKFSQTALVFGLVLATTFMAAFAQEYAGSKIREPSGRGSPGWNSGGRNLHTARSYSQGIYRYPPATVRVQPAIPRSDAVIIGQTLGAAQQSLAVVKKEVGTDKDSLTRIEAIEKHLLAAVEHHKMLHAECMKPDADGKMAMSCCSDLIKELDKAIAEHDALDRKLHPPVTEAEHAHPETPAKSK